ncbi:N-6 DNA methylase [Haloechinothrix salitolerans]|uniref:site-specific DNA-methyltransferase (adenine-specific) n=1 Tax=Haloechinothrix salitolerans TaxID=926830 RepID=A0ABW2BWR7_9PSEU
MSRSIKRRQRDPGQHAAAIAGAVDTAWNKSNHSGRRDVALSVVAALSLVSQRDSHGPDLAEQLQAQTAHDFTGTVQSIYTALVNARPDLTHLVYPLMAWVFDEPDRTLQNAAKRTADAALGEGQLELTGTHDRYDTDLLGVLLTLLKTHTAGRANAQIYTPTPVADLMAQMTPPEENTAVYDPAVGTGGLFRAAAQAMRTQHRDPATVSWYGADIDDLAIASCAVNSLLWGLGPRILLCVANTLAEGDWATRAEAQRAEVLQLTKTIRRDKLMINAIRTAQKLTEAAADDDSTQRPD